MTSLPYKEDVERWSVEQVAAWLQQREMPEVADIYLRKGIDGHHMLNLAKPKQVAMFWDLSNSTRTDVLNIIDQIKTQPTIPHRKSHPARFSSHSQKPVLNSKLPHQILHKTIPVPPNRVASANLPSCMLEVINDELDPVDVPFIDEGPNEDYLVPLSTGALGVMPHPPQPPLRPKKDRCPSPTQISKDKINIQNKELPEPPSQKSPTLPFSVDPSNTFSSYHGANLSKKEKDINEERTENKEDLNAYEIIHENPNDIGHDLKTVDNNESNDKPPDLPNRNVIPPTTQVSATPVVPPRTRSSQHHQNPGSFNPPFRKQQPYLNHIASVTVQKTHEINSKNDFNSNKDNFSLYQAINAYPRHPLVKQSSSPMVGLTSTTNNTAQTPQSLHKPGNNFMLSKYSQPNSSIIPKTVKLPPPPSIPTVKNNLSAQHSMTATRVQQQLPTTVSNVTGNNKNHSQILDLGNGKFVPMNRLYESLLDESYFHPVVRNVLANLLTKDRMFLVRPSTHSKHPLTLSLLEKGKIFNISIRIRSDTKFALGTEKVGEMAFSSVGDIIEFYRNEPIKLEDGSLTYLKWSPPNENDYIQPE